MKQVNEIIELLKGKGCSVEFNTVYEYSTGNKDCEIGVRYPNKHVYHWFTVSIHNTQNIMFITFKQSYSQNTGATNKGTMHGLKVAQYIAKLIGREITGSYTNKTT